MRLSISITISNIIETNIIETKLQHKRIRLSSNCTPKVSGLNLISC